MSTNHFTMSIIFYEGNAYLMDELTDIRSGYLHFNTTTQQVEKTTPVFEAKQPTELIRVMLLSLKND